MEDTSSIVEEIRQNREKGSARLVVEYGDRLYAAALSLCGDAAKSEDLVFATFESVIDKIEMYSEREAFYGWMYTIMLNHYRKSVRGSMVKNTVPMGDSDDLAAIGPQLDADTVIAAIDGDIVRAAVDHLPPKLRAMVVLHYFMDMPLWQIAKFLTIPIGTVQSRLHMARKVLAMRLGEKLKKPAVAVIAAALMLLGATAAVVVNAVTARNSDSEAMVERVGPNAPDSLAAPGMGGTHSVASSEIPSTDYQLSTTDYQLKGENAMTKRKAAAAALTAAMATAPLAAANGDEYQFIVSGDPVAAETAGISSSSSGTVPLTVGTLSGGFVHESEFEARSRTVGESSTNALRSDKFKGIIISVK